MVDLRAPSVWEGREAGKPQLKNVTDRRCFRGDTGISTGTVSFCPTVYLTKVRRVPIYIGILVNKSFLNTFSTYFRLYLYNFYLAS